MGKYMFSRRNFLKLAAATGSASMLAACGGGSSDGGSDAASATGDGIGVMLSTNVMSLDTDLATDGDSFEVIADCIDGLMQMDADGAAIPALAETTDVSEDGCTWTFHLRDANWSNGTPVTARDLSYTLNVCINADRFKGRFASFQGASYDNEKLYVTLGIGDTQFVKLLNLPVIKFNTYGNKLANNKEVPIGSGPYDLLLDYDEETDTSVYRLEAYEGYPGYKKLPVDKIFIKTLPTAEETISAFEDGIIDVVVNDPSSYTSLGYASSNEVHTFATTNMHFLYFNENSPLARYSQFRIALQYAFDRNYLVELLGGNAVPSAVPMYPTCEAYPDALEDRLNYDLEAVKNILIAAGVEDYDEDGQLEFMSGSPQEIDLNFVVCADSSAKCGIARRFQEDMASIGLKVTVHELTWAGYMSALEEGGFKAGKQQVTMDMYYGEIRLRNNFDLTELLQPRNEDNELTNQNYSRSKDNTIVERIERYLAAPDATRSDEYYQLCDYVMNNNGSFVVIGFEKQQIITRRGVCKGINPNYGNPLFGFADWEIIFDEPNAAGKAAAQVNTNKGEKNDD